ncbi:MAG TPA: GYF domain-containing protein [Rhizomicrobium sp.]|nr:GYF domain-containing protein [Rhizomicrobium sp.]
MSATWMVSVDGRAYGPYTDAQMAAFAAEGRLAPQSLIARAGQEAFRYAGEEPSLAALFPPKQRSEPLASFGCLKGENRENGAPSHIVIVADVKSHDAKCLEEEIYRLGQACSLLPQMWLLKTEKSVNTVRNRLVQQLGRLDVLFVVDATNNKAAWFNFGAEVETRIRRVWNDEPSDLRAAE